MENMKDNPISSAAPKLASDEELKAKYGKVYRIGMTVSEDDENEVELVYRFKRPSVASYDRYVKNAGPDRRIQGQQTVHAGRRGGRG